MNKTEKEPGRYVFATNGNEFDLRGSNLKTVWPLERAVYNLCYDDKTDRGIYLKYYKDKFDFNFKRYPIDDEFVNHVLKRYPTMTKSMGILLNGKKGAGKSVIAKSLANDLGLPVIIISQPYPGLVEFIANITFPCVFFMDEFEKNFAEDDNEYEAGKMLLSVMDGVYTGGTPHVFLLTTNTDDINENLLSRPGRILYSRTYNNLSPEVINNYIDENLARPSYREELIEELSYLEEITIDVVKALVDEINIMGVSPKKACEYLNVEKMMFNYNVIYRSVLAADGPNYGIAEFKEDLKNYFEELRKVSAGEKSEVDFELLPIYSTYFKDSVKASQLEPRDTFNNRTVTNIWENGKYLRVVDSEGRPVFYYIENPGGITNRFIL